MPTRALVGSCTAALTLLLASGCADPKPDNAALLHDIRSHHAAEVTVRATVTGVLPDESGGADGPHEVFDISVNGTTVEVDHNLTLAPRVPVQPGGVVVIHGQFEPDPGHPVIHYTHHATGTHPGGWIDYGGKRYQ